MAEELKHSQLPLTALRSFEAAGRRMDVEAAAEELNVTPSAILHQIRQLEDVCGRKLIVRERQSLALTDDGRSLYMATHEAMNVLRRAMADVQTKDDPNAIQILVMKGANHKGIREKIVEFASDNPGVSINVNIEPVVDLANLESYAFVFTAQKFASKLFSFRVIHEETLRPYCAPPYLKQIAAADRPAAAIRLLAIDGQETESEQLTAALREVGFEKFSTISFPTREDATEAAAQGVGVAMIDRNLQQEPIIDGVLTPFEAVNVSISRTYYLAARKSAVEAPIRRRFARLF